MSQLSFEETARITAWLIEDKNRGKVQNLLKVYSDLLGIFEKTKGKKVVKYSDIVEKYGAFNSKCVQLLADEDARKVISVAVVYMSGSEIDQEIFAGANRFLKYCLRGDFAVELKELLAGLPTLKLDLSIIEAVADKYSGMPSSAFDADIDADTDDFDAEVLSEDDIEFTEDDFADDDFDGEFNGGNTEEFADEEEVAADDLDEETFNVDELTTEGSDEAVVDEEDANEAASDNAANTDGINPNTNRELYETIKNEFGVEIERALNIISGVYTGLFASGYGVIEPEGLLCWDGTSGAFLRLTTEMNGEKTGISRAVTKRSTYLNKAYKTLVAYMGIREAEDRVISLELIKGGYNYFPRKLLEFAFGRYASDKDDIQQGRYKKHSSSKMWRSKNKSDKSGYLDAVILKHMREDLYNLSYQMIRGLQESGYSLDTEQGFSEAENRIHQLMDVIVRAYCNCIVISEDSKGKFKLRVSDVEAKLSLGARPTFNVRAREDILKGLVVATGVQYKADISDVATCVNLTRDASVVEFEIIKDVALCNAAPLFAYKALDKLKEQGETVSWENMILGRAVDDSIYMANNMGSNVNFINKSTIMHISAGSRSGKGVMTLNILASAFASGVPVFYLDAKPDMAGLLRGLAPGGQTFAINGGNYTGSFDIFKQFGPNGGAIGDWQKNIPSYALEYGDFNKWGALQYFKALDFCIYLMTKVGKNGLDEYGIGPGTDNMLVVADELWKMLDSFRPIMNDFKLLLNKKEQDGKPQELIDYAKKICKWQLSETRYWTSATRAELKGSKPTLLTIYQDVPSKTSKAVFDIDTPESNVYGNTTVFRALYSMGTEGLIGFNGQAPYDVQQKTERGKKYLDEASKFFAYIPDVIERMDTEDSAEYFKPFLILNNATEEDPQGDGQYIRELKSQLARNGLDPEAVLEEHRVNGQINKAIGFKGYIESMGGDLERALKKSYDIAQSVLNRMGYFAESGNSTVFEYLYDMRPEYLLSWAEMDKALMNGSMHSGVDVGTGSSSSGGDNWMPEMTSVIDDDVPETEDFTPGQRVNVGADFNNEYADIHDKSHEMKPVAAARPVNTERATADRQREMEVERAAQGSEFDLDVDSFEPEVEDLGIEVSSEDVDFDSDIFKPIASRSNDTATGINPNNPREFHVYGSKDNPAVILNEQNSINCKNTGVSPFLEKIYEKSNTGITKYRKRIWNNILDEITNKKDGIPRMKVAIVTLKNGCMFVNRKYINLSGVVGGMTGISLSNVVSFKSLLKKFPGIVELNIDQEMFEAATIEYDTDSPEFEIFNEAKTLMHLNLTDGAKTINIGSRAEILKQRRSANLEAVKARTEAGKELSAMAMVDKAARVKADRKAGRRDNGMNEKVWLQNTAKSHVEAIKRKVGESGKVHPSVLLWNVPVLLLTGPLAVGQSIFRKIRGK